MDGDAAAKTMDKGASAAAPHIDGSDGLHETAIPSTNLAQGEKTTGTGTSAFSKDGAIGSAFTKDGPIGGTAQAIGGPFDAQGSIGKHFNADGAVGGTVQQKLGKPDH